MPANPALAGLAEKTRDPLKPFGRTETLLFYGLAAPCLEKFLAGKLVAAKNWIPNGPMPSLIKRGSREPPLSADEMAEGITPGFLQLRAEEEHLDKARSKLSPLQQKIWSYFLPRKLADFFYATNGETPGKPIDRIFFDIDRGEKMAHAQAQEAAKALVETIRDDSGFASEAGKLVAGEPSACWTGSSFHVYLFFKQPQQAGVYEKFFQYSKNNPLGNYTGRWAEEVKKRTGLKVIGGHEKAGDAIVIDPSQTPSGKLCRVPLGSLHMSDAKTVDGVSAPVDEKMLDDRKLTDELRELTPKKLIEEIGEWAKKMPAQFRP